MSAEAVKTKKPIQVMRDRCGGMSDEMKAYYKEFTQTRKKLTDALKRGLATVPELADLTGINGEDVMWHVIAMKKYGLVEERSLKGEYYTYSLAGKE